MQQNNELRTAWDFVENTGRSIFLTGKAGTGKTTFLKAIMERSRKRPIVVAPTGVAAINAGGVTIHSFFQLPLSPYVPGAKVESKFDFSKEKRKIIASMDLLIIDEISLVTWHSSHPSSRPKTSRYSSPSTTPRTSSARRLCSKSIT